jgi:hypothetical protein
MARFREMGTSSGEPLNRTVLEIYGRKRLTSRVENYLNAAQILLLG